VTAPIRIRKSGAITTGIGTRPNTTSCDWTIASVMKTSVLPQITSVRRRVCRSPRRHALTRASAT